MQGALVSPEFFFFPGFPRRLPARPTASQTGWAVTVSCHNPGNRRLALLIATGTDTRRFARKQNKRSIQSGIIDSLFDFVLEPHLQRGLLKMPKALRHESRHKFSL